MKYLILCLLFIAGCGGSDLDYQRSQKAVEVFERRCDLMLYPHDRERIRKEFEIAIKSVRED